MSSDSGEALRFAEVVSASRRLAATRSRKAKSSIIGGLLEASGPDVAIVVGLIVGVPRQGRIGVGYAASFGVDVEPAADPQLTVVDIDELIDRLASISGPGSVERRRGQLADVLERCTPEEQEYLRAVLTGGVRHGALEGLVTDALADVTGIEPGLVRRAVMLSGDLGLIAGLAVDDGARALASIELEVGRPVLPMLAAGSPDVARAMEGLDNVSVEWKLDGARIQVHRHGDDVAVFTRNLNDVTDRLEGVVALARRLEVESVILDGEALTLHADGRPRSFEQTMSRFSADAPVDDVAVVPFFFDVLHLDGSQLIDRPLEERQRALDLVVPVEHRVRRVVTSDTGEAEAFLAEARRHRHEGVMVKDVTSPYEAGRRGSSWRKVKPAHTLDLVVLAAEWGHGRRTGKLSNLHLGARDPDSGSFVMLGKTFKGLTDATLTWQTEHLLEIEERRTRNTVFVRPELVVEIAFDGVLPSTRYPGGMALRFARVRGYRPDKDASDADTIGAVRDIFEGRW